MVLNSLNFFCLKSFLFLHQFWMRSLPGTVVLIVDFSLSIVSIYPAIPFWPAEFLLRDQLLNEVSLVCYLLLFLAPFNILSLCLIFVSLITILLRMFLPGFILYGTLCTSWTWLTLSFFLWGKFSTIISSKILSYPFFFSSSTLNGHHKGTYTELSHILCCSTHFCVVFSLFFNGTIFF